MQRVGLMAVMAMLAASAQADENAVSETDWGISFQAKTWLIQDAFEGEDEDLFVGYIRPYYAWQPSPGNLFYIQANLYSSNERNADESSVSTRTEARNFAEINEMWYSHKFDFERQSLVLGIQRFGDYSGLWWNAPLTGGSYRYDGTLLKGYLGVGDRSSYLRTDTDVEDPDANSAMYGIAQLSWQWKLDQFVILRGAVRSDKDNNYIIGQTYPTAEFVSRPTEGTWAGLEFRGEIRRHEERWPRYEIEGAAMQGTQVRYSRAAPADPTDPTAPPVEPVDADTVEVGSRDEIDIQGFMARFNFEYVWQYDRRWIIGAEALYASGGDREEGGFVQTGLNTNRAPLYTTNLAGSVTGEALRMTIGNVMLVGVHAAVSYQNRHEGFIALRHAKRANDEGEVLLDSRLVPDGTKDLGTEIDIAYGWYMPVVGKRRGLQVGGFKGKQFMIYASHFEPDFEDPGSKVSGTVVGARFLWAM